MLYNLKKRRCVGLFNDIKDFLLSFLKKLRSKQFIKKSTGIIVICVLTILIPISIAVCYNEFVKREQQSTLPTISVSLFDLNGNLIETDTTREDIIERSPLANIFYNLYLTKTEANKPLEFSEKPNFSFTIDNNSSISSFNCYFNENAKSSYIEDQSGDFYSLNTDAYSLLLKSAYAEAIYTESAPPSLYTPLNDIVIPSQANWTYTLSDDSEKSSNNYETTEELLTYRIAGAITFAFSRTPNICNVTVDTTNDITVFSGTIEELTTLTAEENSELIVTINAEWKASGDFTSYGTQQYKFKIICSEPSVFDMSKTEATGGEIILLSVSDVDNTDSIIYSPLLELSEEIQASTSTTAKALKELYSYKPIFIKKGNNAYALLPIPFGSPTTDFHFSLSCGISKSELTVHIKESSSNELTITSTDPSKDIALSRAQKAEFSRITFHLKHSQSETLLLSDDFLSPTDYGFTLSNKYGSHINNSFTLLANTYNALSEDGISVKSASIGIVSSVGHSELLGNYVIVDHGMGISTWYCGLSDVSVQEKDILKKGDVVGRAGSSSLLCKNGVNVIFSVGEILVNPDEFLK